jgi:hypothetical protein
MSISLSMSTTYLPSGCTLTSTLLLPITCRSTHRTYQHLVCLSFIRRLLFQYYGMLDRLCPGSKSSRLQLPQVLLAS